MEELKKELKNKERTIKLLEFKIDKLEEKLKNKPSAIQIIAFGTSCLALGASIARIMA